MCRIFTCLLFLSLLTSSCDFREAIRSIATLKLVKEELAAQKAKKGVALSGKKNGVVKSHYKNGGVKSIISYKDGVKVGTSVTFYPTGEKQYEIPYKDGMKDGVEKWFYQNGQVYREAQYVKGKRNGVKKLYWKDGKIKAIAHYKNGQPGIWLKEVASKGVTKKEPKIIVKGIDRTTFANEYVLKFSLSDGSKKVMFYLGELEDGKYIPEFFGTKFVPVQTSKGKGEFKIHIPKGSFIMKTLHVVAVKKTSYKNKLVLEVDHNLSVTNKAI